jgi:UDP-N-acetylglucosamine--N-acetylmuramyl-(pentapeptide) pyrophosphoryl-undecaprenol N-acetylglucosamine transferase
MGSRSPNPLTVVVAGGGTGGHLYPGLAVARELLRQHPDARISFAGTARGLEARVVPSEGFEIDLIRSAGLKGKSITTRVRGALLVAPSLWDAWRIVSRRRPDVVVGVGGYSSGPVVLIAALRGVPTLVLEQNAVPGLTNRLLSRVVRAAAITYDETRAYFGAKAFVSGNPVRAEFFTGPMARDPAAAGEAGRPPRLLVLGGSQGAHAVNLAIVAEAAALFAAEPRLQLVHQTGERDRRPVTDEYERIGLTARVEAYLDGVADEMRAADVVVCRAGATTLAELAATGRPAIIVPLPTATDDHQRRNARVLAEAGAAIAAEERDLGAGRLAGLVAGLLADPNRRRAMSAAMRTFAQPDAAARIAARVRELAR